MQSENNWKCKSLQNLEKGPLSLSGDSPSYLVDRCDELAKIPLNDFTIEDIRLMIGQSIGLVYLVPLTIEKLYLDLFAEGDFYPGDLLSNLLAINKSFWEQNRELWMQVNRLIENRKDEIIKEGISLNNFYSK